MMIMVILKTLRHFVFLLLAFPFWLGAQNSFTISGTIRDAATGEQLIGVSVAEVNLRKGTVTNEYGYYALNLPAGKHTISVRYLGYEDRNLEIVLDKNARIDLELAESSTTLKEVVVTESALDNPVRNTEMGVNKLQTKEVKKIPQLMGEVDILRTLTLMPGISTVGEGASGFNVRGGNADQNLILGDEAPVYNASHLAGFFSIFNADAVREMKIFKGGIPAEYGGRLSSVLDIRLREGNNKRFSGTGGIGTISSRLLLEGPIIKDRLSWLVSARRSYADLFIRMSSDPQINTSILYFYDLNSKINFKLNDKNTFYLSAYFGRDVFGIQNAFGFDWGNSTATLRWNSILNAKHFANFTLVYSDYRYNLGTPENSDFNFNWQSRIQNYLSTAAFTWYLSPETQVKYGITNTYYQFDPAVITGDVQNQLERQIATEPALYIGIDQKLSTRWSVNYGLRYSSFFRFGPGTEFDYRTGETLNDSSIIGSRSYSNGEVIKSFLDANGFEPRLAATYLLNEEQSLKLSYNRMRQYIHLISNTTSATPIDVWRPSGTYIEPATSDQVSIGYFRKIDIGKSQFDFSLETYYKDMRNIVEYKDGAELIFKENIETELIAGLGRAYGLEVLFRKNNGKLTGWIAYTWARTERLIKGQFVGEQINSGEWFPSNYDKTHDISIVATYQINEKWDVGAVWVFQTGRPITPPSGRGEFEGIVYPIYFDRNSARTPNFHRLDLSANYTPNPKPDGKWESSWAFSIYNAYNRRNPYSVFFRQNQDLSFVTEAIQLSIFGSIVPAVTYNFKF